MKKRSTKNLYYYVIFLLLFFCPLKGQKIIELFNGNSFNVQFIRLRVKYINSCSEQSYDLEYRDHLDTLIQIYKNKLIEPLSYRDNLNLARAYISIGDFPDANEYINSISYRSNDPLVEIFSMDNYLVNNINNNFDHNNQFALILLTKSICMIKMHNIQKALDYVNLLHTSNFWSTESIEQAYQAYIDFEELCTKQIDCQADVKKYKDSILNYLSQVPDGAGSGLISAAQYNIGRVNAISGNEQTAIDSFLKAIALAPKVVEYQIHYASYLNSIKKYDLAKNILLNALKVVTSEKDQGWIWGEMGYVYLNSGDSISAIPCFEKSISLKSQDVSYQVGLSRALKETGHIDEAIQLLKTVVKIDGNRSIAWFYLGDYYRELKEYDNSIAALNIASKLEPRNIDYLVDLVRVYIDSNKLTEAKLLCRQILQLDPNNILAGKMLVTLDQN